MKRAYVLPALLLAWAMLQPALAQTWGPVSKQNSSAFTPVDSAGAAHPASIAGSGSWTSACTQMGSRAFNVFAAMSGAATLAVPRFADSKCTQPVGTGLSTDPSNALALTTGGNCPSSSNCGNVGANDGTPYAALKIVVTDTSGSTNSFVGLLADVGPQ